MKIYYQNTRSIRNAIPDIYNSLACSNLDIVAFTETWLDSSFYDGELSNNFNVMRADRNFTATGLSRGGGVLLAVNTKFNSFILPLNREGAQLSPLIDILAAKISLHHYVIYIFVVYVPPTVTADEYDKLFDFLSLLPCVHNNDILILGDFNIPKYASYLADSQPDNKILSLVNFLNMFNLQQQNFVFNTDGKLLDLVICNKKCAVEQSDDILTREDDFHPALNILLEFSHYTNTKFNFPKNADKRYNFRNANFQLLYDTLQHEDWTFVNSFSHIYPACRAFYDRLYAIFDMCVPKSNSSYKRKYPPWFNGNIIKNVKLKAKFWRSYKQHGNMVSYTEFKRLRTKIKVDIDLAYANYVRNIENNIVREPQKFWSHVNSKKKSTDISTQMFLNDQHFDNPNDIINSFADFFSKSFLPPTENLEPINDQVANTPSIAITCFSENEVFNALKKLKPKLTAGPDDIPSFLIRDCAAIFSYPLSILFNLCIRNGQLPDIWKYSKVCPVFKKGEKNNIANFRPISIICNFCKGLEILLHDTIYPNIKNQLSIHQHGFVKGRSTTSNLICITQSISEAIDQRNQMDVIYTDFSKAFDTLDHAILLKKMSGFGFSHSLLVFFQSYLLGRKQYVAYSGFRSVEYLATSGVPQGSILGPLLFNLFINDIVDVIKVDCLLYADDLKLFRIIDSIADCNLLQNSLSNISDWCVQNKLNLNVPKCNVMSYTTKLAPITFNYSIDNVVLQRPETFKDLGVIFDKKLSFVAHINNINSEAFKTLGFLFRSSREFTNTDTLKILYFAFVRSKLEYASLVWNPYYVTHINNLEKVQRRFVKLLWFKSDGVYPSVGVPQQNLLNRFSMTTLENRRDCYTQIVLYNLIHNKIDCQEFLNRLQFFVPSLNTRIVQTFYLSTPRSNRLKFSPLFSMCHNYNKNCVKFDIFNCTVNAIKKSYSH